jgi:hypothetical protein
MTSLVSGFDESSFSAALEFALKLNFQKENAATCTHSHRSSFFWLGIPHDRHVIS